MDHSESRATNSRALDDSHRRLDAVLSNATVAIFLMDETQRCVYMNSAAEKLTGYSLEEVLEFDRPLHDIIHHTYPDGRPFPREECAIDRAFPQHHQTQGEDAFVHKNGSFCPVAFTASPIRDEASKTVGTIIEVRDIREEKQARERQRLLMDELNHRVKNTLATVHAVAWQTFRHIDQEAVNRFNGRLATLSKTHNILTDAAWHKVSFPEVVRVAIEPFGGDRVQVEGPDCNIHPKAAVTLSMVLYELGTNAVKYGALSNASGRVTLSWSCLQGDQDLQLDIVWKEEGGPRVTPPPSRGFGSRLIERQLPMEFGGAAELDFHPRGLICRIKLNVPINANPLRMDTAEPSQKK